MFKKLFGALCRTMKAGKPWATVSSLDVDGIGENKGISDRTLTKGVGMIGKLQQVLKWVYVGLGLALAHWGLSWYAFVHYRTALTYYERPAESLFDFTLAIPQCLDKHVPPDVTAIFRMLPVQSLLLAAIFTLLPYLIWRLSYRQHWRFIYFRIGAVVLEVLCVWSCIYVIIALWYGSINCISPMYWLRCKQSPIFYIGPEPPESIGPDDQPVGKLPYQHYPSLAVRTAWLNRFLPLPGQVLDIQYDIIAAFCQNRPRIEYADIAAKVSPAEVDRWRNMTWGKSTPVTTDPSINCDPPLDMDLWGHPLPWPADAQWRHTSKPEYFINSTVRNCYLIIYRREGIVFLHLGTT